MSAYQINAVNDQTVINPIFINPKKEQESQKRLTNLIAIAAFTTLAAVLGAGLGFGLAAVVNFAVPGLLSAKASMLFCGVVAGQGILTTIVPLERERREKVRQDIEEDDKAMTAFRDSVKPETSFLYQYKLDQPEGFARTTKGGYLHALKVEQFKGRKEVFAQFTHCEQDEIYKDKKDWYRVNLVEDANQTQLMYL